MGIKYFCDCCKEQIGGGYGNEMYQIEIRQVPNDKMEMFNHICIKCVKKIKKLFKV